MDLEDNLEPKPEIHKTLKLENMMLNTQRDGMKETAFFFSPNLFTAYSIRFVPWCSPQ